MNETALTIVGNVVEAPEWRVLDSGRSMATFRVASTERRYDRTEGSWIDGDSLFLRVTCWRQLADNVHDSLHRGDPVVVTGRLVTRSYEMDGQRRSSTYVEAAAVGHDLTRGVSAFRRAGRRGSAAATSPAADFPQDPSPAGEAPSLGDHAGAVFGSADAAGPAPIAGAA